MPILDLNPAGDEEPSGLFKMLYIGESGSGKTGSLISLIQEGYHLRVIDLDSGLDILKQLIGHHCPERASQLSWMSFRDNVKIQGDTVRASSPKAMIGAMRALDKWEDETVPAEWGPKHVIVIDSLTLLGKAAYLWAQGMAPGTKDRRQWYGAGQEVLEALIAKITSTEFKTNVIVITHVGYDYSESGALINAFPTSLGQALRDKIPTYFNTLLLASKSGAGQRAKRTIRTVPTAHLDLKNPVPFKLMEEYPLETGLATIAKELTNV